MTFFEIDLASTIIDKRLMYIVHCNTSSGSLAYSPMTFDLSYTYINTHFTVGDVVGDASDVC